MLPPYDYFAILPFCHFACDALDLFGGPDLSEGDGECLDVLNPDSRSSGCLMGPPPTHTHTGAWGSTSSKSTTTHLPCTSLAPGTAMPCTPSPEVWGHVSVRHDRSTLKLPLAHPSIPNSMFIVAVSCDQKKTVIVEVSPSTTTSTSTVLGASDRMLAVAFEGTSPSVGTRSQTNVLRPGASFALQDSTGLALYVPSSDPSGCG